MRKPYPSDLTDAQWEIIKPLIPVNTVGRPRTVEMREVLNAIFSLNRAGCRWDMLPHDLPPRSTVHDSYRQWRADGTWQEILDALRREVRVAAGKEPSPGAGSIDSRTVKATEIADARGSDGARRSRDGSDRSSWTRRGYCWSWWSAWPPPTTARRPPRCWADGRPNSAVGWSCSGPTRRITTTDSRAGWSRAEPATGSRWSVARPARGDT